MLISDVRAHALTATAKPTVPHRSSSASVRLSINHLPFVVSSSAVPRPTLTLTLSLQGEGIYPPELMGGMVRPAPLA